MLDNSWAVMRSDLPRIAKLNKLNDPKTFWESVRKITRNTYSDKVLSRWQILAEARYEQIKEKGGEKK